MVQYTADSAFAAVADPTRRGILRRLGAADTSIGELAEAFDMTLTGMRKHVRILEDAGLVRTEKVGRVRTCRVGPQRLDEISQWIDEYKAIWESRLDRLEVFLERTKGASS
jgi:DNA-binding transcriptional ArsR family regulator